MSYLKDTTTQHHLYFYSRNKKQLTWFFIKENGQLEKKEVSNIPVTIQFAVKNDDNSYGLYHQTRGRAIRHAIYTYNVLNNIFTRQPEKLTLIVKQSATIQAVFSNSKKPLPKKPKYPKPKVPDFQQIMKMS